jgi:steroid 5-alpha reductase family enzyme
MMTFPGACILAMRFTLFAVNLWAAFAWILGRHFGRVNIIDTLWGIGFSLMAAITAIISTTTGVGNGTRQVMLTALTLAWGTRLSWYIGRRSIGRGEDPRYTELLQAHGDGRSHILFKLVYLPQMITMYIVSLPIQVGMFTQGPVHATGWAGALLALIGITFESIGDAQMNRFKADPGNKRKVFDAGLWRYTRHPNYFGEACFWIGLYMVTAEHWPGALTFASPALMIYLLIFGTGKRLLERSMLKRPGYTDYMNRTSGFIPLPPRSGRA